MRVGLITPLPPPMGGIAVWSEMIKRNSGKLSGVDVLFFNTSLGRKTVPGRPSFFDSFSKFAPAFSQFFNIYRFIKTGALDVVHISSSAANSSVRDIFTALICRIFSVRFILHLHFGKSNELICRSNFYGLLFRLSLRLSDRVVVLDELSEEAISDYMKGGVVRKIPNPYDFSIEIEHSAAKKKQIVFPARMVKEKGIWELIEAWELISKAFPDWTLVLAGPCDDKTSKEIVSRIDSRGIVFLGELSHARLIELMQESYLMCLPSYSEGFPLVVLEALAAQCFVIATRVGAIPEIVSSDYGILVQHRDVDALVSALSFAISNISEISSASFRARTLVRDRFSIEYVLPQYRSLWLDVCGKRSC